jgi:zinc transport system permease protein
VKKHEPWAAISLNDSNSVLTAIPNDYNFEAVFERQISALAKPGDVAIGLSTSGRSRNVLNGLAVAMKIVGVLLITSLLIIPAAAARRLSSTPEQMAIGAAVAGSLAVIGGLALSYVWDTPAGPSIVATAFVLFIVVYLKPEAGKR